MNSRGNFDSDRGSQGFLWRATDIDVVRLHEFTKHAYSRIFVYKVVTDHEAYHG
jgi:hypothetical protein